MPEPKKVTNGEVCEDVVQEILELGVWVGVRFHSHGSQGVVRASVATAAAAHASLAGAAWPGASPSAQLWLLPAPALGTACPAGVQNRLWAS